MNYILLAPDGVDLYNVDGAPFNERYHLSDLTDELITEIFSESSNRVLILDQSVFDRVSPLVHFPIRRTKFGNLFGLNALTLSSGCKVKCQAEWNKEYCQSIFRESWIASICPDEPEVSKIFYEFNEEAEADLRMLIDKPKGSLFGLDYETSGIPKRTIEEENPVYRELQGRSSYKTEIDNKSFQITGVSICWLDRDTDKGYSYYFNFLSILSGPRDRAILFYGLYKKFTEKHSETNWVYNGMFETTVSYILFNEFNIYQDAAVVNYIEGRNMHRQNLKVTTQRILHIRSWDDEFDILLEKLNYLLSDAFQVNWDKGTVIQGKVEYVWYQSPYFAEIFRPYGDDMVSEAKELAAKSFMNPFLCIPGKILGKYCNVDSYSTAQLARYMEKKYSKECIDVLSANLRFHVYLNFTGNYIDSNEYKRQKSIANKASNWGMLLLWQGLTKLEIDQYYQYNNVDPNAESVSKGNDILVWCLNNNVRYNRRNRDMLRSMLDICLDWNCDYQVNTNKLHNAFPWDYSYEALYNQIVAWGGLGNIYAKKNIKFWNGNAWIVAEYGTYDEDTVNKLNAEIWIRELHRRQEWLWYLTNKIPNWDSDVPEYITLQAANSFEVNEFVSSDGKPWYESPEFDEYVHQMGIKTTTEDPHYFISGCLNCGAPSGMEYVKNQYINNTDGWISALVPSWMKYDNYVFGYKYEEDFYKQDFVNYDIWDKVRKLKFIPQKLFIDPEGNILEATPVFDDLYTELSVDIDTPAGIIHKAFNARELPEEDRRISTHPEYIGVEMMELDWEDHIGYRYLYVDHFISKEHFIALYNTWWKREIRGYKDFMECLCTSLGTWESLTLNRPWDWKAICSTKLDATGTKLDEVRPLWGLFTWRKFRKILGTYLKNLLIEGANYSRPEDISTKDGLVISEYSKSEWEPGWDICRGHPNWNCMGVHTKRWCLAGDTPILMEGGRLVLMKDMGSEVGNKVTSYSIDNKLLCGSKVTAFGKTISNADIYAIEFDTGLVIRGTYNHRFLTPNGYVELTKLNSGDEVIGPYKNSIVTSITYAGKEDVYDIEVETYHNFLVGTNIFDSVVTHNSSGFHTLFGHSDTKKIITVPKDKLFFYLDISQAEPRTLAYKSGDPLMKGWYESGKDIYIELAKLFNPDVVNATNMTDDQKKARLKELRGLYKILVLAIMYGMGNGALASMTGKPMNVAKQYKRDFLDAMPELEKFIESRVNYPSRENPSVLTILGDYLELYSWDEPRWKRQGINFCIQSFSAMALVAGFENMVRTAIHDGLVFSPIGTVHDSSQMIMDARFIYNCQAHFDLNYTEYLYKIHGVKYKGDIKIGVDYHDLSTMTIVNEDTIQLEGTADSINKILLHLRNAGVTDMKLNVDESTIIPDYYSSVPKQIARITEGGAMPDKSNYKVQITFGDDVLQFHRSLVEGEISKVDEIEEDNLSMSSNEFDDSEEIEIDE